MSNNLLLSAFTYGLAANRPTTPDAGISPTFGAAINGPLGVWYYATDTGVLSKWVNGVWSDNSSPLPVAVGATKTAGKQSGVVYQLDTAAGSVLTLPAAIGSGLTVEAYVKTSATSNAHKILTSPVTDVLIGRATGSVAAGTTLQFSAAAAAAYHSIQMPFAGTQPSGGLEGDIFHFRDVAAGVWLVEATYESGTTSTTPFSTATT